MHTLGVHFSTALKLLKDGCVIHNNEKELELVDGIIYETSLTQNWTSYWMPNQKDILSEEWRVIYER